jgi:recombination protein RecA
MFGDKYITSGGKALQFHASIRLRLKGMGALKIKRNDVDVHIGVKTRAVVVKNRLGPPMRFSDFNIFFDRGIDNYGNWIEVLKANSIITGAKSPYNYVRDSGEKVGIDTKTFASVMQSDTELRDELYKKITDVSIMKYQSPTSEIREDVEIDDSADAMDADDDKE